MCGFIGITGVDAAVRKMYDGLLAIQHRGQDSAGIITYHGHFHVKKGEGLVREIEADAVIYQELGDLTGAVLEGQSRIKSMCTACFSGEYPTGDITTGRLMQIENERLTAGK